MYIYIYLLKAQRAVNFNYPPKTNLFLSELSSRIYIFQLPVCFFSLFKNHFLLVFHFSLTIFLIVNLRVVINLTAIKTIAGIQMNLMIKFAF